MMCTIKNLNPLEKFSFLSNLARLYRNQWNLWNLHSGSWCNFSSRFCRRRLEQAIFLAPDGLGQALSPEICLESAKKVSISPRTMTMCRATLRGDVPTEKTEKEFLFTPSRELPKEIGNELFLGTIRENETYQVFNRIFQTSESFFPADQN